MSHITLAVTLENYLSLKARVEAVGLYEYDTSRFWKTPKENDADRGMWEFAWNPPEKNAKEIRLVGWYAFYLLESMKNTLESEEARHLAFAETDGGGE